MTKYYLNGELVRISKRNDYEYIVTINANNCGKASLHTTKESALKAAAKTRVYYEKQLGWAKNETAKEFNRRIENCKVYKLEKVSA